MGQLEDRYISLLTDFGFKRIFGTKPNKDLLINFLNSLFEGFQVIKNVKYLNSEHVGDVSSERKAIFDVYCENERGERFIVEMQNAYQKFFKDRSLFYSTFPIREQAPKGAEWDFKLEHVYTIAFLNFNMKEDSFDIDDITHDVGLLDKKTHMVFNDKLSFKYIEISKFNKREDELETLYDKWLYVMKNLSRLDKRPNALKEKIFTKLFKEAEIAKFNPTELREYEDSLKAYRDIKNSIDTALAEGIKKGLEDGIKQGMELGIKQGMEQGIKQGMEQGIREGMEQGQKIGLEKGVKQGLEKGQKMARIETAKAMLRKGFDADTVSAITYLSIEEINNI